MTAKIVKFDSRAELQLKPPTSISKNIKPALGGVAVHYGGSEPNPPPGTHAECQATWRAWQNYHLSKQWVDIAYTAGFCNHGHVLAGRGYGVRTGANGTNDSNDRYYAFCWVGGGNAVPTQLAYDALEWLIADARVNGGAGDDVLPHSAFFATSCCGDLLRAFTVKFHNKPVGSVNPRPPASPKPPVYVQPRFPLPSGHWYGRNDWSAYSHSGYNPSDRDEIQKIQTALTKAGYPAGPIDGYFGDKSAAATIRYQRAKRLMVDGKVGPQTWNSLF